VCVCVCVCRMAVPRSVTHRAQHTVGQARGTHSTLACGGGSSKKAWAEMRTVAGKHVARGKQAPPKAAGPTCGMCWATTCVDQLLLPPPSCSAPLSLETASSSLYMQRTAGSTVTAVQPHAPVYLWFRMAPGFSCTMGMSRLRASSSLPTLALRSTPAVG
jgi:hypothetical protein